MALWTTLILLSSVTSQAWALGCMATVCKGNSENELVSCNGKFCGHYKSKRYGGELIEGVDLKCSTESPIYAPFDGDMYFWRPYGHREGYRCADEGVRIEGIGQWQGYHVLIAAVRLDFYGGRVEKGQRIGVAMDNRCTHDGTGEEYVRLRLFRQGRAIDPTFHLRECMCTGQICESNPKNELLGQAFKHDSRYNGVRGWDIRCPMVTEDDENPRVPDIYSPIDAKVVGRSRLYADQGVYKGCDNNGVVLIGMGAWEGFEVVLYNVRYRDQLLGNQRVVQGEPIATRLNCGNSPDSVFMEVRYRGIVSDISDMISAKMCKMPDFSVR